MEWPDKVKVPKLPEGYEFSILAQAKGILGHPWYIRVSYKAKNGNTLFVRGQYIDKYYESPYHAISAAQNEAYSHYEKRNK